MAILLVLSTTYVVCLVAILAISERVRMKRKLSSPNTNTPPARQLAPYREDHFGRQLSREKMLEDEVTKLRNELAEERDSSRSIYNQYMNATGRKIAINGRYLDVTDRSGQIVERHPIRALKRGTNDTGPG